jgi:hypothetical protein
MRFLFLGHQGLGDHIVMNGLIHTFIKMHGKDIEELCIIAQKNHSRKTLEHLYSDFPLVTFHWITPSSSETEDSTFLQLHKKPYKTCITHKGCEYIGVNFGFHSTFMMDLSKAPDTVSWVDYLYMSPLNLSSQLRFTEFRLPSDLSVAQTKYEALLATIGSGGYILIHDDPSRERHIDPTIVKAVLKQDAMLDLPVLYIGIGRYSYPLIEGLNNKDIRDLFTCDSILDMYYILKNASACHLMESCISCLVDCSYIQTKLYMHSYICHEGKSCTRSPWVRITK